MKYTALVFLMVFSVAGAAQDVAIIPSQYTAVVEVPGASQAQLYGRAKQWLARTFKSSKAVIQSDDKEAGTIIGKATFIAVRYEHIDFIVSIAVKEGRYKYIIDDLYHTHTDAAAKLIAPRTAGRLALEKPACGYGRMTRKYWAKIKRETDAEMRALIASLRRAMSSNSSLEDF